jgi:tRNA dimethylallyltransferase
VVVIALYGPTSSGKTRLSVDLAERIGSALGREVVIISADSRQVYRYLDIGTSKTTAAEMRGIRHEMLDVTEPVRKLELEEYVRLASAVAAGCRRSGAVPFVVGGTGVYVKALLEDWSVESVDRVGQARSALRRDFPRALRADAYAMLRRLDRAAAARVHPNNYDAVINALATVMAPARAAPRGAAPLVLGLDPGQRALDERVARTYDDQVRRGLPGEVADLAARYDLDAEARRRGPAPWPESPNQVLHTHGYREYFEVALEQGRPVRSLTEQDRADVRRRVVEHIRGYTRRQRTWFRKLPNVRLVRSADEAFPLVARLLRPGEQ